MNLAAVALAFALTANPTVVSHIGDPRIGESSGLAYSAKQPDLAYTMNDSKNRMVVYAIKVSTGKVVGQTDLTSLNLHDPESIYVDPRGRLWLGDLGDNDSDRNDVSIVSFDEPGATTGPPKALQRFPVKYSTGPENVEGMLVNPASDQVYLINKNEDGHATIFSLPSPLQNNQVNLATDLQRVMPARVADATFTPDGKRALVETAEAVVVYDPTTWTSVGAFSKPSLPKGESMTVEPSGSTILLGTEGNNSPIMRVALPAYAIAPKTPTVVAAAPQPTTSPQTSQLDTLAAPEVAAAKVKPVGALTLVLTGGLILVGVGLVAFRLIQRRRRLLARHRRIDERQRV